MPRMAEQAQLDKAPFAATGSNGYGRRNTLTHSSQSSNTSTTLWDQSDFNHEEAFRPVFDQDALDAESSRDAYTLSAATSTRYSESVAEGQASTSRKKKRSMAEASVLSYNSERDASQFTKELFGRGFNTLNDAYILPSDGEEWERLDKQHVALVLGLNGLVPCPKELVDAVLAPVDGEQKRILDIGCGTGIWAIEMARQYPHASVVGVDLAPTSMDPSLFPDNITFEIDDVNKGLAHFHGQFDLVHARCISGGIQRFGEMMEDAELCVRSGGLIVFVDGDGTICSTDRLHPAKFPGGASREEGSWFSKVVREAWYACNLAGSGLFQSEKLQDAGLWNHPLCDPDTAASGQLFLPIGPWAKVADHAQSQQLQYAGALIRQAFLSMHRAYHGILLKQGMSQDMLNDWSNKVDEELSSMRTRLWVRFRFCWARRRADDDLPAPPLVPSQSMNAPNAPANAGSEESLDASSAPADRQTRYPFFSVWTSAAEAAAEIERRRKARGVFPEPDVQRAWEQKQLQQLVS